MIKQTKLTSVKVDVNAQKNFKYECLENGMNFQTLVNRCLVLYVEDNKFKKKIDTYPIVQAK